MTYLENIVNQIKLGKFEYDVRCVATICSSTADESEDGLYYPVFFLAADDSDEDVPYARHTLTVGESTLSCREYLDSQRKWFIDNEEIDYSLLKNIHDILQNVIKPFDFERYAIDNFDGDAVAESIPYGDPHCLIVDDCVFMIEKGGNKFREEDVRNLLKSHNWADERIDNAINEGYEIISDLDMLYTMHDLPIVMVSSSYWEEA